MTVTEAPPTTTDQLFVKTAITAYEIWLSRITKLFEALSDEQMLSEIAPGKNRPVYLLGHLLVVNDAMIPQFGLGTGKFGHLREAFVAQPDRAAELPPVGDLRQNWKDLNSELGSLFASLSPAQWLEKHTSVSEEDFAKEPHRNRLAILLSRTSHLAYHLGQLMLLNK